ncbi:DUF3606 domain-containing protein [Granulicella cerasi]|uniref:DUF3606 domain-containing protein n=1 Tax=Granulicella cerasi TaxID=741063 RepID=A0ABW1ZA91_9BACT|nr:DUF3606 domain-containing protein [Granulicella cerasi]
MSKHETHEHEQKSKEHQPQAVHEEQHKGPHDPKEINPKLASDIAYWSHEFGVSGDKLHELVRVHGTHVEKIRHALKK